MGERVAEDNAWIAKLVVGDKVLSGGSMGTERPDTIRIVTGVTKCLIRVDGDDGRRPSEFDRQTGRIRGPGYKRLYPVTDEALAHIERTKDRLRLYYKLSAVNWQKLPLESMREIEKVVDQALTPNNKKEGT